jgi:hypothetical protein
MILANSRSTIEVVRCPCGELGHTEEDKDERWFAEFVPDQLHSLIA